MPILNQLQKNKGTLSSALGKSLAEKVLKGEKGILNEAVELINYDDKNVRAGAAKIIEIVAEKKPELVAHPCGTGQLFIWVILALSLKNMRKKYFPS